MRDALTPTPDMTNGFIHEERPFTVAHVKRVKGKAQGEEAAPLCQVLGRKELLHVGPHVLGRPGGVDTPRQALLLKNLDDGCVCGEWREVEGWEVREDTHTHTQVRERVHGRQGRTPGLRLVGGVALQQRLCVVVDAAAALAALENALRAHLQGDGQGRRLS